MTLISFINAFLSYAVLLLVIVAVCAVAVTIGITLRRRKDQKAGASVEEK